MKVGVVNHGGFGFENDTVDEEPLFADDLDEYEEQDEEDDPPPLPPPIQTTPQKDQGMPAVNLYASINVPSAMYENYRRDG